MRPKTSDFAYSQLNYSKAADQGEPEPKGDSARFPRQQVEPERKGDGSESRAIDLTLEDSIQTVGGASVRPRSAERRPAGRDGDQESISSASSCTRSPSPSSDAVAEVPESLTGIGAFEVFCGHAGLTRALTRAVFSAQGIDYKFNASKPVAPCIWVDMASETAVGQIKRLAIKHDVQYMHFCPPNGTASSARNSSRSSRPPLRSDDFPDGVEGLEDAEARAVDKENKLFDCLLYTSPSPRDS